MQHASSGSRLSRRHFIAAAAGAALTACRAPYPKGDFRLAERSAVAVLDARDYGVDLPDVIRRGIQTLGVSLAGRSVLLKPNIVEYETGSCINTHPLVVAAAAIACRQCGARSVAVAEGPGHRRDIEYLLSSSGLYEHLNELRLPFTDLNHDDVRAVRLRSGFTRLRELYLPVSLLSADFVVSLPKLKTHHWAGMTCGMKNLFGVVPGAIYGWPKNFLHFHGIFQSILDLTATIRPALTIVDAIVGMEGDGPIMGRPRRVGALVMGTDVVAVDATCARLIGLDPMRLPYVKHASRFLGNSATSRIEWRAERPSRFATRFEVIDSLRSLQLPK